MAPNCKILFVPKLGEDDLSRAGIGTDSAMRPEPEEKLAVNKPDTLSCLGLANHMSSLEGSTKLVRLWDILGSSRAASFLRA